MAQPISTSISAATSSAGATRRTTSSSPSAGLDDGHRSSEMSWMKGEPDWMLDYRLKSYEHFERRPMPNWGGDMSEIYFDDIYYYIKPTDHQVDDWDELPDAVKDTYEKLGIPEAERKYLAGVTAQYESEVVYHRNREDLEAQGVIFSDMDTALREYPEIVKQYFGTVIPQERQQVRRAQLGGVVGRLVHLRAAGRQRRDAAAGLLPHQRREHGPVRAHADHRRRGQPGALHRGLLGAGVHHRLAALGRGRDHRQAAAPGSPTRPSRTGRTTSSTWSPSGPGSRPRATWSGSTATSAAASP